MGALEANPKCACSAHVGDAERIVGKLLAAILLDIVVVHRERAGKADQAPAGLVAVAAVDRVGEHAFHDGLVERGPEHAHRQAVVELDLAGGKSDQHLLALRLVEPVEQLAVGLAAVRVGRRDAGAIELRRRERELIALARRAQLPRPLHIEALALAPGARERAVDVDVDADLGALGRQVVGGHHVIDQRLDEGRFVEIEEFIALRRRCCGRRCGRRLRFDTRGGDCGRGGRCRAADHGGLQEIAPAEALLCHRILPLPSILPRGAEDVCCAAEDAPFTLARQGIRGAPLRVHWCRVPKRPIIATDPAHNVTNRVKEAPRR